MSVTLGAAHPFPNSDEDEGTEEIQTQPDDILQVEVQLVSRHHEEIPCGQVTDSACEDRRTLSAIPHREGDGAIGCDQRQFVSQHGIEQLAEQDDAQNGSGSDSVPP